MLLSWRTFVTQATENESLSSVDKLRSVYGASVKNGLSAILDLEKGKTYAHEILTSAEVEDQVVLRDCKEETPLVFVSVRLLTATMEAP